MRGTRAWRLDGVRCKPRFAGFAFCTAAKNPLAWIPWEISCVSLGVAPTSSRSGLPGYVPLPDELAIAPELDDPVIGQIHEAPGAVHDPQGERV